MRFVDIFDPENPEHITAFRECNRTGMWPEGFRPDDVKNDSMEMNNIIHKIAKWYVDHFDIIHEAFRKAEKWGD